MGMTAGEADSNMQHAACIVCGGHSVSERYRSTFGGTADDAARYFLAHREATAHGLIVACDECGFVFTADRFSSAEYDRIYGNIRRPERVEPAFASAADARFRRLATLVRRYAPAGGRFVDFGCGDGRFLSIFDDANGRGFEVGSPRRMMVGRSEVIVGQWSSFAASANCPPGSLDFVTAFDVLEHLPLIASDVALVRQVLKPEGLFIATVPNVASTAARVLGGRWGMLLLEHLWYFSPTTLRRFMAQAGFETVDIRSVPFDAPLTHVATRLAQSFGTTGSLLGSLRFQPVLPVPAGIMLGVFRATSAR
jgi:SAM-dependent methyltransferase